MSVFHRPNHMSQPVQLADGTWWTIAQSYEKYIGDDWSGLAVKPLSIKLSGKVIDMGCRSYDTTIGKAKSSSIGYFVEKCSK